MLTAGRTYNQTDKLIELIARARYEILDIRDIARNTIASYFFLCCLGSRISLVHKVQGYVKRKYPDQMGF